MTSQCRTEQWSRWNDKISPSQNRPAARSHPRRPNRHAAASNRPFLFQSRDSVSDLIKLDDTPTELEDFDPLKHRDKIDGRVDQIKTSTDSALLHEYGLDFSRFGLSDFSSSGALPEATAGVPKGWTTFN